jgi:hypothetical protein
MPSKSPVFDRKSAGPGLRLVYQVAGPYFPRRRISMQFKAPTAFAVLIIACAVGAAAAQDKAKDKPERPFNVAKMGASEAQKRLETGIRISLAGRNCKLDAPIAEKDDERLTGLINALTKKLRLDPNRLERQFYVKSFDEYEKDEAKFCKTYGPQLPDFVKRLP